MKVKIIDDSVSKEADQQTPAETTRPLAASQRRCMICIIRCIYSKIPPGEE